MKVLHLSSTDSGGAIELHAGMLEYGIQSRMLVKGNDLGGVSSIFRVSDLRRNRSNLGSYISKLFLPDSNSDLSMFSLPLLGAGIQNHPFVKDADVIYLHFVAQSSFISIFELENLLKLNKPVVFVTRDMWSMTGGCHSFLDCESYQYSCSICPHYINSISLFNWPQWQLKKKKIIFSKYPNLIFVGISDWCSIELKKSFATKNRKSFTIPNAINVNLFTIYDKVKLKRSFGFDPNIPILGFGARSVNSTLKGFDFLKKAIKILDEKGIIFSVASFGSNNAENLSKVHYHLGYIDSREKMAEYFNAIDIYISPTLAEAFGNTVAEAMACGTPVVGFETGGLIDIIDHRDNGYLAKYKSAEDLANGIIYFLEKVKIVDNLQFKCREKIVSNFSREVVVSQHVQLLKKEFGI